MLRRGSWLSGIVIASVLSVAGCAAAESPTETDGAGGGDPATQAGGSLTVAAAQGLQQLNPAIRTFAWEEALFPLLWNGLTTMSESGEVVSDLAESWSTDDAGVWTFKLRSGVTFSNGDPFTADDVVATFEYYLDENTATQERNKIAMISSVVAVDDTTVQFTLDQPVATFPAGIVWVRMLHVDSLDQIDSDPIGTGPFVVSSFTPDDTLTLVANENYFGEAPGYDTIEIVKAADSTSAVTALRSGDIDLLWAVPQGDVALFEGDDSITLVRPANPSQWPSWEVDTESAPFNDVRARQALAYAIDRQTILEAAYYGQGFVSPTNNALSEGNAWFGGDLIDYSYDLDKAKALFAEAGITEGSTLTWWGVAGQFPEWNTSGEILQASLKEIGINLVIDNNDIGTWVEAFYPAGKSYPGYIVPNFQSTPAEPAYSLNFYLNGRCECNWDNSEFEQAFADAVAETGATERADRWATVQEIINREVPLIVPLQSTVVTATSSDVTGVWSEGGGQLRLENARPKG
jgi:peptide/nickel transport system substrate-binding protein